MTKLKLKVNAFLLIFLLILPIDVSPNENANMAKAIIAEKQGQYNIAIKEYEKVLAENPNFIELYQKIGHIYSYKLKNHQKAIEIYLKGLSIAPDIFGLNMSLMHIYFDLEDINKGIRHYKKLSQIRKEGNSFSFPRKSLKLIFEDMSQEEIIIFCKDFIALNPTDIILREKLSHIYMDKKDYNNAKREYKAMLRYGNKTGFIYFSIGVCDYYLEMYKESLISFKKAREFGSYVPEKYFELLRKKIGTL